MYKVCGDHKVSDVDISIQASCDTGVDDNFCVKIVDQDLCADCRVYLADPGADHNYVLTLESSCIKFHGGFACDLYVLHTCFQFLYFYFHCADDTNTSHNSYSPLCVCFICKKFLYIFIKPVTAHSLWQFFIISLAILLSVNISLLFFHYNKTSDYMETFFAFCYNSNSSVLFTGREFCRKC